MQVHRARPWTTHEQQYLAYLAVGGFPVFVRDPILVVGNHAIELAVKTLFRRREIFSIRELLQQQRVAPKIPRNNMFRCPRHGRTGRSGHPTIQIPSWKGDIIVMGHDVLVGNSGLASDRAGIDWLQRYLGPEDERADCIVFRRTRRRRRERHVRI